MKYLKKSRQSAIVDEEKKNLLLAEYSLLLELRRDVIALGESRSNFFLAGVSASLVGLALLNDLNYLIELHNIINGFVFIGLILWGSIVFVRTVEVSISTIQYTRGLNRIRAYFVQYFPEIKVALILPINDDYPQFHTEGNLQKGIFCNTPTTTAIILSVVATIGITLLLLNVFNLSIKLTIFGSVLSYIVVFLGLYRYMKKRFEEMEQITTVNFPREEIV